MLKLLRLLTLKLLRFHVEIIDELFTYIIRKSNKKSSEVLQTLDLSNVLQTYYKQFYKHIEVSNYSVLLL